MAFEPRKSARTIAFNSKNIQHLKTVNIVTSQQTEAQKHYREVLQLTGAQTSTQTHPTLMDSGGTVKGLPTVFVSGYGGPA